ncbi:tyrosine-protein phosphatase [Hoeflea sp. TYP-13]|uniref:tyrosine-protein phosphatase n=1 Tax=Hoeflea sp. TYP-13 TaxID=3230023 RepID=UPI0034C61B3D
MIDLHSHILPAIDDGAGDQATSLEMARMAVEDGITHMACTPHIVPGLWNNNTTSITNAVRSLRMVLSAEKIELALLTGADIRVMPDLPAALKAGDTPTLRESRYFLFEPTHQVVPPRIEDLAHRLIREGFVPIVTHPERLTWLPSHYDIIERLNDIGCLIQITAGSVTGAFGKAAKFYAEQMLDEGRVDILATDAHNTTTRPPLLSAARDCVAQRLGEKEAVAMVMDRPAAILLNKPLIPQGTIRSPETTQVGVRREKGLLSRIFRGDKG